MPADEPIIIFFDLARPRQRRGLMSPIGVGGVIWILWLAATVELAPDRGLQGQHAFQTMRIHRGQSRRLRLRLITRSPAVPRGHTQKAAQDREEIWFLMDQLRALSGRKRRDRVRLRIVSAAAVENSSLKHALPYGPPCKYTLE